VLHSQLDIFWLIVAGTLVLFMQPGFLGLEGGAVRAKNNVNVAAKNFTDFCFSAMIFWAVGYGLMFGTSRFGLFGGDGYLFRSDDGFKVAFLFFQVMFCSTAATIVSGAVAERITFAAYLCVVVLLAALVYPLFGHWAWGSAPFSHGGGWLKTLGFHDFAGSTVVHSVGGWSALAAMIVIGPRIGRYDGSRFPVQAQGIPFTMFGIFLIFIGWIGFNGGSTLAFDDRVPGIILNTLLAGVSGGIVLTLLHVAPGRPASIFDIGNGCVAGLVAVTASADVASPMAAVVVGLLGGALVVPIRLVLDRAEVDDAVGAVPAHLGPGIFGTLAVPFVTIADAPLPIGELLHAVSVQAIGVAACGVWSFFTVFLALKLLGLVIAVRVEPEMERRGLNVAEHGVVTDMAHLIGRFGNLGHRNDLRDLFDQADDVASIELLDPVIEAVTGFRDVLAARRWQITTAVGDVSTAERQITAATIEQLDQQLRHATEEAYVHVSQIVGSDLFTLGKDADKLGAARVLNALTRQLVSDVDSLTRRLRQETDTAALFGLVETARERARTFCRKTETLIDYCDSLAGEDDGDGFSSDLGATIRATAEGFEPQARLFNVLLSTTVTPGLGAVAIQPARLRKLLRVLVENAIQFNRDGGIVQITAGPGEPGYVVAEVIDSGIGLDDREIERVGRPFAALDADRSHPGLSLPMARLFAERAGGRLDIRSEKGVGTRIIVTLPLSGARTERRGPMRVMRRAA